MTELHNAALKGNVEEIEHLLTSGANVQAKSTNGLTILFVATHEGHWNLLLFLISYGGDSLFDDKQQVCMSREEHNVSLYYIFIYIYIYYSFFCKMLLFLICQYIYEPSYLCIHQ